MKKVIPIFIAMLLVGFTSHSQSSDHVIKVTGEAVIRTVPEEMVVHIPIEVKDPEYDATAEKLTRTFNELMDALVKTGLERDTIKSNSLRITEDYNYIDRGRVLVGYVGRIEVVITMNHDTEALQKIMKTLADERFKFGYSVNFKLSDDQEDKLLEEAMTKAVADARRKADILVDALGIDLGAIKEVNYDFANTGNDVLVMRDQMMMAESKSDAGDLVLNPQEMELRKEVRVIWIIEN